MKALAQFGGFVAVSAALHLAVWAGMPEGGAEGSGAAGDTRVSLQGASGELEALVREWLEAPEPQLEAEAPLPPQAVDAAEQALSRPDPRMAALRPVAPEPPAPMDRADLPDRAPALERAAPEAMPAPAPGTPAAPVSPQAEAAPARPAQQAPLAALPEEAPRAETRPTDAPLPAMPAPPALGEVARADAAPTLSAPAANSPPRPVAQAPDAPRADAAPLAETDAPPSPEERARRSLRPQARPEGLAPERPAPVATVRAAPRREATPPGAAPQRQAAQQQTARGTGGGQAAGNVGAAPEAGTSPAQRQRLIAQWGGAIRASVERQKRYPRGTRASGRVALALTVTRHGQLAGVRLSGSSGHEVLDGAALRAVQRARFPAAPKGLREASYGFTLTLSLSP